jgi:hypothetical protein
VAKAYRLSRRRSSKPDQNYAQPESVIVANNLLQGDIGERALQQRVLRDRGFCRF